MAEDQTGSGRTARGRAAVWAIAGLLVVNALAAVLQHHAAAIEAPRLRLRLASPAQALAGGTVGVALQVSEPDGAAASDCPVTVRVGDGQPQEFRTDSSGSGAVAAAVPAAPGDVPLTVTAGDGARRTQLSQQLEIVQRHQVLFLLDRGRAVAGDTVHWLVRVTDAGTGRAVADSPITVTWRGSPLRHPLSGLVTAIPQPPMQVAAQHARSDEAGVAVGELPLLSAMLVDRLTATAESGEPALGQAVAWVHIVPEAAPSLRVAVDDAGSLQAAPMRLQVTGRDRLGWPLDGVPLHAGPVAARLVDGRATVPLTNATRDSLNSTDDVSAEIAGRRANAPLPVGPPLNAQPTVTAVDGPLVWGEPVLNRLELPGDGRRREPLACRVTAGERVIFEGETDGWGTALFETTWAEGDRPQVAIEAAAPVPVHAELAAPEGRLRVRLEAAEQDDRLRVLVLDRGTATVTVALVQQDFVRSAAMATLREGRAEVTLAVPPGLAGPCLVVVQPWADAAEPGTAVRFDWLPTAHAPGESEVSTLLVAAAPTPAAGEAVAWPLPLTASGLSPDRVWPSRSARVLAAYEAADASSGRRLLWPSPGAVGVRRDISSLALRADAEYLAAQAAAKREEAFNRWYLPALWTELTLAIGLLALALSSLEARSVRIAAVVLPLGAAVLVSRLGAAAVPASAGLAALALVCVAPGTWAAWLLVAVAAGVAVWGVGAEHTSGLLLSAAACALAGVTAVLREMVRPRPRTAAAGAGLVALGVFALAVLAHPEPALPVATQPGEPSEPESKTFDGNFAVVCPDGWSRPSVWTVGEGEAGAGLDTWQLSFGPDGGLAETYLPGDHPLLGTLPWPESMVVGDEVELSLRLWPTRADATQVTVAVGVDSTRVDLRSTPQRTVSLAAGQVTTVPLRLRAVQPGMASVRAVVTPTNGSPLDLAGSIRVVADGVARSHVVTQRLLGEVTVPLDVPADALPGSSKLQLSVYADAKTWCRPSLSWLANRPSGDLTAAAARLLATAVWLPVRHAGAEVDKSSPEFRAAGLAYHEFLRRYVAESDGRKPSTGAVAKAWGLLALARYARSATVAPELLHGLSQELLVARLPHGSWVAEDRNESLMLSAMATWALASLPEPPVEALTPAVAYLTASLSGGEANAVELAWTANALLAADPGSLGAREAVLQLTEIARRPGAAARWPAPETTALGSHGTAADAEIHAAALLALLVAGSQPELVASGIDDLLARRRSDGSYGSSAATALAVAAQQLADSSRETAGGGAIAVQVNQAAARQCAIAQDAASASLDLTEDLVRGDNTVAVQPLDGSHLILDLRYDYAVTRPAPAAAAPLRVTGRLSRAMLKPGEPVDAIWSIDVPDEDGAEGLRLDITLPPGWQADQRTVHKAIQSWHGDGAVDGQRVQLVLNPRSRPATASPTVRLRCWTSGAFRGSGPQATLSAPGWPGQIAEAATGHVEVAAPPKAPDAKPADVLR